MKTITRRQFVAIKRVAQNVSPLVDKKNKLFKKMAQLNEEIMYLENEIEGHEGGVISITGGFGSEYIVKKVITLTNKTDKDGNIINKTEYVPTKNVTFNEETKLYEIMEPSDKVVEDIELPEVELPYVSEYGSDFDADTEKLECNNN